MRLQLLNYCLITLCLLVPAGTLAQQILQIDSKDATLTVDVYSARGTMLYLWLPPEGGFHATHTHIAQSLNDLGIEVWFADLYESRFLPPVASSLELIPSADITTLLNRVRQTGKHIVLVSSGRGIFPLLRGVNLWQQSHTTLDPVRGVILLSPQFYLDTPEPGEAAEFHPIVSQTNLPIFILQPRLSPWFWKLEQTVPVLQHSGSEVYVRILPDVRDRFYYRPDATTKEQDLSENLARLLKQASTLLAKLPITPRPVAALGTPKASLLQGKKDRQLRGYRGNPIPPSLILQDIKGIQHELSNYRGQVVLVNFWASWCPPCVQEMPSMQRLANKLGAEQFTILAVNMAEDEATITDFLNNRVHVNFPILLDHDGSALKRWGVFAFPTSYVIDKQGNIRYALFGSVEWDNDDMLSIFSELIQEP